MHTEFWWESLKERNHLEGLGVEGMIILQSVSEISRIEALTGFIWVRTG